MRAIVLLVIAMTLAAPCGTPARVLARATGRSPRTL